MIPRSRWLTWAALVVGPLLASWAAASAPDKGQAPAPPALVLPRSGQISAYDATGHEIDFKGSRQDGELQRGLAWPDPRFIVNREGTVSDALTGLMWLKEGDCFGKLSWPTAKARLADFNQGASDCRGQGSGYHDWSLPDLEQLASLIDAQADSPAAALKLSGFNGVGKEVYWSSTVYVGQMNVWTVDFGTGAIAPRSKMERHGLLLVRVETPGKNGLAANPAPAPAAPAPAVKAASPPTPAPRLVDNGDGTVTDTLTGLMWLKDGACLPAGDWQGALAAVNRLDAGQGCASLRRRYQDWLLPNAVELRSLTDLKRDYPALPEGHPFRDFVGVSFWTSTTVAASPATAWAVDFDTGALLPVAKAGSCRVLAVRSLTPPPVQPRRTAEKGGHLAVADKFVLPLDPEMESELRWPPSPRFISNGDGTSMDTVTGITWLTDGKCLGERSWTEIPDTFVKFNEKPDKYKCAGFTASKVDWELPTLAELRELVATASGDRAAWLNKQGLTNVQSSGVYWSGTATPLNLYFADAVTIKTGKAGNYPKSLKFFVLAKRKSEPRGKEPLLGLTANANDQTIRLTPKDALSLKVFTHTFGWRRPADFSFWYETPSHQRLWLTGLRAWSDKPVPVFKGPLFNLENYEIFRSVANGLAPGGYTFHFAVDTHPDPERQYPAHHYEVKLTLIVVPPPAASAGK